jgi:hypothetical protein
MLRQMSSELEANQELRLTVIPSLLPKHCLLVHSLLWGCYLSAWLAQNLGH